MFDEEEGIEVPSACIFVTLDERITEARSLEGWVISTSR